MNIFLLQRPPIMYFQLFLSPQISEFPQSGYLTLFLAKNANRGIALRKVAKYQHKLWRLTYRDHLTGNKTSTYFQGSAKR